MSPYKSPRYIYMCLVFPELKINQEVNEGGEAKQRYFIITAV